MAQKNSSRAKSTPQKSFGSGYQDRQRRKTKVIFAVLAAIIILSWIISMVAVV
jgi:hypothetical protein